MILSSCLPHSTYFVRVSHTVCTLLCTFIIIIIFFSCRNTDYAQLLTRWNHPGAATASPRMKPKFVWLRCLCCKSVLAVQKLRCAALVALSGLICQFEIILSSLQAVQDYSRNRKFYGKKKILLGGFRQAEPANWGAGGSGRILLASKLSGGVLQTSPLATFFWPNKNSIHY